MQWGEEIKERGHKVAPSDVPHERGLACCGVNRREKGDSA